MNRLIWIFLAAPLSAAVPQATILDGGSTNVAGVQVTIPGSGTSASVRNREGATRHMKLSRAMCDRFQRDLKAAGSLAALPANHCMKSASFGSTLYIEAEGVRSADLSCPSQADPRAAALRKDASEILGMARSH